jgi:hypothetical protein
LSSPKKAIAEESRRFLVDLFTDLRGDLEGPSGSTRQVAIYDALLAGLDEGTFPDDDELRGYVAELARGTDEANGYAQARLEHRAMAELADALNAGHAGLDSSIDREVFNKHENRC